jgi:3-methyladenine DNA glycosylase AlkD
MTYKLKRQLKRLSNKEFASDIKKYIKSSHEFYEIRMPELKMMAKRLHEEYELNDFYKVFNRLWNSLFQEERTLAIYTLQLYKENFDLETWKFLKGKLAGIKSWDMIDNISENIIGYILLKNKIIRDEIITYGLGDNIWHKRMALISTIPLIKNNDTKIAIFLSKKNINESNEQIQKAIGIVLKEIGEKDPEKLKSFILKNIHMPEKTFDIATINMKELRNIRNIKSLENHRLFRIGKIRDFFK